MNVSRQYSGFLNQATQHPFLLFSVILALFCVLLVWQGWHHYHRVLTEQTLLLQRQSDITAAQINRYLLNLNDSVKRFIVQHETHISDLVIHPGDIASYARIKRALNTIVEGSKSFDITDMQGNSYLHNADRGDESLCKSGIKDCLYGSDKLLVIEPSGTSSDQLVITIPWAGSSDIQGQFLVGFNLGKIIRLLSRHPLGPHQLVLIDRTPPGQIDLTVGDQQDDLHQGLVDDEGSIVINAQAVAGKQWLVVALLSPEYLHVELWSIVGQQLWILFAIGSSCAILLLLLNQQTGLLQKSKARLKDFADSVSARFWEVDEHLKLKFISDNMVEKTDFFVADLLHQLKWELGVVDQGREAKGMARLDKNGEHEPFQDLSFKVEDEDGKTHHLRLNGKPIFDHKGQFRGYIGSITDESDQIQSRLRAQQVNDQLQGILENLPGVVFRCVLKVDGSLHYPYISTGTQEVLGYKTEELQIDPSVLFRATHAFDFKRFHTEVQHSARMLAPMSIEYRIVAKSGQYKWVRDVAKPRRLDNGDVVWDGLLLDISDRKDVEEKLRLHSAALSSAANSIVIADRQGRIAWVNPSFTRLTGYSFDEAIGQNLNILNSSKQDKAFYTQLWKTVSSGQVWAGELINRRKDGSLYTEEMTITPVIDEIDEISSFIAIQKDISERKQLEAQLIQARKLESIGQLAAGIAHEINTPIQYVSDNTHFLREAFEDLWKLVSSYEQLLVAVRSETVSPELLTEMDAVIHDIDSEYIKDEIPTAIEQSLSGMKQVSRIVRAMKEFSHPGSEGKELSDLNRMIENTVTVARNEWKYVAEMITDLDPDLPLVPVIGQVLGQVVLNIVVNAAHAIADVVGDGSVERGTIKISTRVLQNHSVEIRIADTGKGIPESISNRVFDPFFTTKDVGKGTGQGLAIAHSAVVDKHDGRLSFESKVGKGTTFIIELPLQEAVEGSKGVAA